MEVQDPVGVVVNKIYQYVNLTQCNKTSTDGPLEKFESTKPITVPDNGTFDFTILINDWVAVFYVNNELEQVK